MENACGALTPHSLYIHPPLDITTTKSGIGGRFPSFL